MRTWTLLLACPLLALLPASAGFAADPPPPAAPAAAAADDAPGAEPSAEGTAAAEERLPLLAQPAAPAPPEPELLARLEAGTLPADFIKLGDDAEPVLARYRAAATADAKGAVLLLPPPGRYIGDDRVIAAVLEFFPPGGWAVIAVQTPLLAATAQAADYEALRDQALVRAKAGLEYLAKQQAPPTVVVVGHGASVDLAREVAKDAGQVTAVAAIGPWAGALGEDALPLLDLVPDRLARDVERATARQQEARRGQRAGYKLHVLAGADWRLNGFEAEIARRIRGFAERLPPPAPGDAPAAKPTTDESAGRL